MEFTTQPDANGNPKPVIMVPSNWLLLMLLFNFNEIMLEFEQELAMSAVYLPIAEYFVEMLIKITFCGFNFPSMYHAQVFFIFAG